MMRTHLHTQLLGVAILAFGAIQCPAHAQSVDYGGLEQLFGEPVTTSVTGKPQRATDAPANIEIITQDDIRRTGASNIPDVLQFVTGVDVRRTGLAGGDVGLRGYNQTSNPSLMVLINGRQVYLVDYGRVAWTDLPVQLDEIRQIEVIKGPNSALYGFNAAGGVINIVTYDPLRDDINVATVRGGTQDYLGGSVVATGKMGDKAGVRLSFGGFRAHDFPQGALSATDQAMRLPPRHGAFDLDARAQLSPTVEMFLDVTMSDSRIGEQSLGAVYDTSFLRSNSVRTGISADTRLGVISLSAYRNQTLATLYSIDGGLFLPLFENQVTEVVQASDLMKLGSDHTVRFEFEYRSDSNKSLDTLMGSIRNRVYAGSVMWDWQMTPDLSITHAVRFDHLELAYDGTFVPGSGLTTDQFKAAQVTVPTFNSGLVWHATDVDTFRFTAARGVQMPTLLDFALQVGGPAFGGLNFIGRPDLHPQITWNLEADYDRAVHVINSTFRAALFAQRTDDIIANPFQTGLSILPSGLPAFIAGNVGYSTAAGMELGLKGHASNGLRWNASYALVSTTDHTTLNSGPTAPNSIVEYAHSAPRHVVIAGIGYTRDKIELDLNARWQSSFLDFRTPDAGITYQPVEVSDYVTVNGRAGYRLTDNLTVALSGQQ